MRARTTQRVRAVHLLYGVGKPGFPKEKLKNTTCCGYTGAHHYLINTRKYS